MNNKINTLPKTDVKIFLSYSREDQNILARFRTSLEALRKARLVDSIWYDALIEPGEKWEEKIQENLIDSDIVLLLISPSFIASEFCFTNEMGRAVSLHNEGKLVLIPILIRPCLWQVVKPISEIQVLPKNGVPITDKKWDNEDTAYLHIGEELLAIIGKIKEDKRILLQKYHFDALIYEADKAAKSKDYESAINKYVNSLDFYETLFIPNEEDIKFNIDNLSKEILYVEKFSNADHHFKQKEYDHALIFFEEAVAIKETKEVNEKIFTCKLKIEELNFEIQKNKFILSLEQGNAFFINAEWESAFEKYKNALSLYDEKFNSDYLLLEKKYQGLKYIIGNTFDEKKIEPDIKFINKKNENNVVVEKILKINYQLNDIKFQNEKLYICKIKNKYGIVDIKLNILLDFDFTYVNNINDGMFAFKKENNYYIYNTINCYLLPSHYEEINVYGEGLLAVNKDNKWGFIDTLGNTILPFEYDSILDYSNTLFSSFRNVYKILKGISEIGKPPESIIKTEYIGDLHPYFNNNAIGVVVGTQKYIINKNGEIIEELNPQM